MTYYSIVIKTSNIVGLLNEISPLLEGLHFKGEFGERSSWLTIGPMQTARSISIITELASNDKVAAYNIVEESEI